MVFGDFIFQCRDAEKLGGGLAAEEWEERVLLEAK